MRLPLLGSVDLLDVPARTVDAVRSAVELVPRLVVIVGEVEDLIGQVRVILQDVHQTVQDASAQVRAVAVVRQRAGELVEHVSTVVGSAERSVERVTALLDLAEPLLRPLLSGLTAADAAALQQVLRQTPALMESVRTDVLPLVDSLESVAPSLEELVVAAAGVAEMLGSVPGMGRAKKRVAKEHEEEQEQESDDSA